jgi:beta-catenin-like protein 1
VLYVWASLIDLSQAPKKQKATALPGGEETSHILGIVSSLFTNLPSDSPARVRVLAKFVEGNYEKVEKLLEIHEGAHARLKATEKEIAQEKLEAEADEDQEVAWYLRRLDGGLFTLQTVDYIIAWIAMEDDGVSLVPRLSPYTLLRQIKKIRAHIIQMLNRRSKSLKDVAKTLQVFHDNVDEEPAPADADMPSQKEILQGLIAFLNEC